MKKALPIVLTLAFIFSASSVYAGSFSSKWSNKLDQEGSSLEESLQKSGNKSFTKGSSKRTVRQNRGVKKRGHRSACRRK